MASENDSVPTHEEIRRQLSRMLSGEHFSANENPARFLAFVVERALQNEPITQAVIGFELFPGKYARTEIPDVRVTARNLRMVLAKYYAHEGAEDLVLIKLPTPPGANKPKLPPGKAYKPVFSYNPRSPAHKEYSQGLYMLSQSRLTQAEKHFARAIELQPRYWEPYLGLATAYLLCSIRAGVQDIGEDSSATTSNSAARSPLSDHGWHRPWLLIENTGESMSFAVSCMPINISGRRHSMHSTVLCESLRKRRATIPSTSPTSQPREGSMRQS